MNNCHLSYKQGFRLGNTSGASQSVGPTTPKVVCFFLIKVDIHKIKKKIVMWKNGFSLDDGPLREYNNPANQAFLKQLQQGYVNPFRS
jgi:UBX domain-containing protein 1